MTLTFKVDPGQIVDRANYGAVANFSSLVERDGDDWWLSTRQKSTGKAPVALEVTPENWESFEPRKIARPHKWGASTPWAG